MDNTEERNLPSRIRIWRTAEDMRITWQTTALPTVIAGVTLAFLFFLSGAVLDPQPA
jgi:hypothetical protein